MKTDANVLASSGGSVLLEPPSVRGLLGPRAVRKYTVHVPPDWTRRMYTDRQT